MPHTDSAPVTVVTGANSGIGRATAIHLATQGHRVVGTVRSTSRVDKLGALSADAGVSVDVVELDVADDDSVRDGFQEILDLTGRIDNLVNNAGVGSNGVLEESSADLYMEVMNVNLGGVVRCAQAVLPQMRERGSGVIVNITSIAGFVAAIAQQPYVASKWALEGVSEALAQELAPFGIRVAIVQPGVTRSAIFAKNDDAPNASGAYQSHYDKMFQFYAAGRIGSTDAVEVGRVIHHAITTDRPQLRYPVSWGSHELAEGHRAMSDDQWLELGLVTDMGEYCAMFEDVLGLDIAT